MAYSEILKQLLEQSNNAYRAMVPNLEDAHVTRIHAKEASESRLLHSMDTLDGITLSGVGTLEISDEVLFDGKPTVRMCPPSQNSINRLTLSHTKIYGDTHAIVSFPCEDWREWNRLTFEIYPELPTYDNALLIITLLNDVHEDLTRSELLEDSLVLELESGKWNHVVWEIPNTHRDRIIGIRLRNTIDGRQAGSDFWKKFHFGPIHLEKVDEDYYEGWELDDRIAFCHVGYEPDMPKFAYTQTTDSDKFQLVNAESGNIVFTAPVKSLQSEFGEYAVMDFTEYTESGRYFLRIGSRETKPFMIDCEAYASPIWKAINFFFEERCGCEIEGIHRECHLDTYSQHPDGRMISSAGGWHDAGDLSQGLCNTAESAHSMLDLAARIGDKDPVLANRLLDEARWGLEWCLKTRYGDGYRTVWTTIGSWTQNILGDIDDIVLPAGCDAFENFCSSAAEAAGARAFRDIDPEFAENCLASAVFDFNFAYDMLIKSRVSSQNYGQGAVAAGELYRTTGNKEFLDKAAILANHVLNCQQKTLPDWDIPIRGFFRDTDNPESSPLAYSHRAHEQAPVMGLSILYESAPEHPDAPKWKEGLELYGEYIKTIAAHTAPYGILPNAIYRSKPNVENPGSYDRQARNGIRLSDEYYLRVFPVAGDFRGFNGTLLTKTKAVTSAARVLGDKELLCIGQRQLEWILGLNPFSQCTMYGEGYNYPELFVMFSHQLVGAIPVGIWTNEDNDKPFFPQMNHATYKEVWVHSTSRFLWVLADIYDPADAVHDEKIKEFSEEINAVRKLRCGCSTACLHLPCHEDCFVVHPDGKRITVGGGWHNGEDYSHNIFHIADIAVSFMDKAAKTKETDAVLYRDLLDEARHGLEWMLRTRFTDGFRAVNIPIEKMTNGIIGDDDDVNAPAHNDPYANFYAAVAEAKAASAYRDHDKIFADYALRCAIADFRFAYERMYARYVIYDNWCLENVEFGMHMVASDELLFAKAREAAELLFAETGDKFYSQLSDRFSKEI